MPSRALLVALLSAAALVSLSLPASADSPTPSPSARPTPPPSPPSPRASATATASASPSPSASPDGADPDAATSAAIAAAQDAFAATTLLQRIEAMRAYTQAELGALASRERELEADRDRLQAQLAATTDLVASESARLDALLRASYRSSLTTPLEALLDRGSLIDGLIHAGELAQLGEDERRLVDRLRALRASLADERRGIDHDAADLALVTEAAAAKRDELAALDARAQRLVDAQRAGGDPARVHAEIDVLTELANEQAKANLKLQAIVARIDPAAGSLGAWSWPAQGAVSQPFGPTALGLEPALTYDGVTYPHFHPALDIAAPLFSPVVAAADGRIAFVGHFTDGAMVVLVAHPSGYVTMYAHLDDGLHPPLVRVGDAVARGQPIGAIGLTGVTTGAHLHFEVLRGATPIDPLAVLPPR